MKLQVLIIYWHQEIKTIFRSSGRSEVMWQITSVNIILTFHSYLKLMLNYLQTWENTDVQHPASSE